MDHSPPPEPSPHPDVLRAVSGSLLAGAVGDALGLPMEGLPRIRSAKIFPPPHRMRIIPPFPVGLCSDDTEHSILTLRALSSSVPATPGADPSRDAFLRRMSRLLPLWLSTLPPGAGLATIRACLRLAILVPPERSGVFSAGNGPCMRAPVIGAFLCRRRHLVPSFVEASTLATHSDPEALAGATALAVASSLSPDPVPDDPVLACRLALVHTDPLSLSHRLVTLAGESVARGESTLVFADSIGMGRGVTGHTPPSVACAFHSWLSHPGDIRRQAISCVELGGDTDTVAHMCCALSGSRLGQGAIPLDWLDSVSEWPASVEWMRRLAVHASLREAGIPSPEPGLPWMLLLLRNLAFIPLVLAHGFARMAPPY